MKWVIEISAVREHTAKKNCKQKRANTHAKTMTSKKYSLQIVLYLWIFREILMQQKKAAK